MGYQWRSQTQGQFGNIVLWVAGHGCIFESFPSQDRHWGERGEAGLELHPCEKHLGGLGQRS